MSRPAMSHVGPFGHPPTPISDPNLPFRGSDLPKKLKGETAIYLERRSGERLFRDRCAKYDCTLIYVELNFVNTSQEIN